MRTTVSKIDKGVLLSIPNRQYADKIRKMFPHFTGVTMDDGRYESRTAHTFNTRS